MNLLLLSRLKTRDAALLYERLAQRVDGSGVLESTSYASIAADLNDQRLTTSRNAAFTESVVRSRLKELEELNVVERTATESASTFDLYVFRPFPSASDPAEERRQEAPVDHYGGKTLFDYDYDYDYHNENDNENDAETPKDRVVPKEEYINIKINNKIKAQSSLNVEEPVGDPDTLEGQERRPLVDDVVDAFPRECEWYVNNRRLLARQLYEPGLHADLLDRAVVAVGKKYATVVELKAAIRAAKDEQHLREQTHGYKGRRTLWETFAPIVKSWYDGAGVVWTPTSYRREPAPRVEALVLDE